MKHFTYIVVILILVSCSGEGKKKVKKPDDLISKDQMVDIIYDMSLVSAAKGVNRKLMEQEGVHPDQYVYKKHGIDSIQFAKSNEYYAFDLDAYNDIYKRVKFKLEKNKKQYTDLVEKEKKERDSLNKQLRKERDSLKNRRDLNGIKLQDKKRLVGEKNKLKAIGRIKNVDTLKKSRNQHQ